MRHAQIIDVEVSKHGGSVLLTPLTSLAAEWIQENADQGQLVHGRSLAVPPREAAGVVQGMYAAGLNVEQ